jgi:hypothetical protein
MTDASVILLGSFLLSGSIPTHLLNFLSSIQTQGVGPVKAGMVGRYAEEWRTKWYKILIPYIFFLTYNT